MSIFGKILAIVNVFAVLGAMVLMAMNYAKRQNWEYAVFRQDLMMNGLPLDDKETDEFQEAIVGKIGPKTQQELFQQASPNSPVTTQEAEVARVKNVLAGQVQAAGDKKKQIATLARILTPMANTSEERRRMISYQSNLRDDNSFNTLRARLFAAHKAATTPQQGQAKPYEERFNDAVALTFSDPPGPFAEAFVAVMKPDTTAELEKALEQSLDNQLTQLQGHFEQMFRDALSGGEGGQPGAPPQQKRSIARLLFNMVEVLAQADGEAQPDLANNPAYRRFFIVAGVKAAVEAVNDQASLLQSLTFETQAERLRERNLFAFEHRKTVDLVRDMKTEVDQHNQLLDLKKKEREAHDAALALRRFDVKNYEAQLAAERQKTTHNLEQLRKFSDSLLGERVKVRQTSDDNQKLEKQIRALEAGR